MENSNDEIRYMTPAEAASLLMISPVTLRHWALAGKLAFVTTPGGHRRFSEDEVKRFAAQNAPTDGIANGGMHRILVVDDDAQVSGFLKDLLQRLPGSVEVEIANDGFEAGQKLLTFRPHTVLLDLMMPGIRGFEVCRKIKDDPATRDVRVVMMTGYHTLENMMHAIEVGAEACLAKPIDKAQLFKTIVMGGPANVETTA